jgi:hypothetical protein
MENGRFRIRAQKYFFLSELSIAELTPTWNGCIDV